MAIYRPISLEFGVKKPDHRGVLTQEEPNTDPQTPDLSESIDALLGEIDATCAQYNGESEQNKKDVAASESGNKPIDDLAGNDALEAIEQVGKNAEALLEDTIGGLLETDEKDAPLEATPSPEEIEEISDGGADDTPETDTPSDEPGVDSVAPADEKVDEADEVDEAKEVDEVGEVEELTEPAQEAAPEPEPMPEEPEEPVQEVEGEIKTEIPEPTPEATEDAPQADDLQELDELLGSVNEELLSELDDQSDNTEPAAAIPDEETTDEPVDELVEELVEELGEQGDDLHAQEQPSEPEAEPETEAGIESNTTAETDPPPAPDAAPESEQSPDAETDAETDAGDELILGDLDAALADVGDELMMGDFETPEGELIDPESLEDALDPAMLLDQLDLPDAPPETPTGDDQTPPSDASQEPELEESPSADAATDTDESAETGEDAPADQAPAVKVPDAIRTPDEKISAQSVEETTPEGEIESIWQTLRRVSRVRREQLITTIRLQVSPMAAQGVLLLSKPVASKSAQLRDSIGYIAIWTLFLASVLWFYTIFVRATPTPTPTQAPSRVVEPSDDLAPIENQLDSTQPD